MSEADDPEPVDAEFRAGELQVGCWGYQVLWERARKLPPRRFPFGFGKQPEEVSSADE